MISIRLIEIENYRAIKKLVWRPSRGLNCLIGPGDSGKSSILDAIELCLGSTVRRTVNVSDSDFHGLDTDEPISISLTLGGLNDALLDLDEYALYLRGFDTSSGTLNDEPKKGLETVVTLNVSVDSYREPVWGLTSIRATARDERKKLSLKERTRLLSSRLGVSNVSQNLTWGKGSVLTRLTEEELDVDSVLIDIARNAKAAFGDSANTQLKVSLDKVKETASSLGVPTGGAVRASLDTQGFTLKEGAVALHNSDGVPLRCLGTGSARLLVAGLQRDATQAAPVVLVDEVEFGLEPHRLTRLLNALGSKLEEPISQVFITTHSPVALQQLKASHLHIVRGGAEEHVVNAAGMDDDVQGTLRKSPSSFLAKKVIVCEGASEQGLLRGVDDWNVGKGGDSLLARGVSLLDAGGGSPKSCIEKAILFAKLGYDVAAFIDNDVAVEQNVTTRFSSVGGRLFTWEDGFALEDALFAHVPEESIDKLIDFALENVGLGSVDEKIKEEFGSKTSASSLRSDAEVMGYSADDRQKLGRASRTKKKGKNGEPGKKSGWFKSIDRMERVGREIVGPAVAPVRTPLTQVVADIFRWTKGGN
ncbi:ATP-dependent endonuclease [Delftia sp. ASV31]|uniref:ATP-dependent nuclease n=1 Tax=Delftia sp. ASV31 TaxID=2795113 RepID=UPI0018ED3CE6|nr:ATP-binding protein [Delftia sp. ASV31]